MATIVLLYQITTVIMSTRYIRFIAFLALSLTVAKCAYAQTDTLKINFKDAERSFLDKNLVLLAQKYNVDASKALVQQAKLWDNPVLSTDQNITDANKKLFDHRNGNGQVLVQLSQLFKTAGKRGKEVQVAQDGVQIQQRLRWMLIRSIAAVNHWYTASLSKFRHRSRLRMAHANHIAITREDARGIEQGFTFGER